MTYNGYTASRGRLLWLTDAFLSSRDGSSIEYEIASRVASVWVMGAGTDVRRGLSLSMEFSHNAKNASLDSWNLVCGAAELAGYGYGWDPHICQTEHLNDTGTRCLCATSGTFAVLLTARPPAVSCVRDILYKRNQDVKL